MLLYIVISLDLLCCCLWHRIILQRTRRGHRIKSGFLIHKDLQLEQKRSCIPDRFSTTTRLDPHPNKEQYLQKHRERERSGDKRAGAYKSESYHLVCEQHRACSYKQIRTYIVTPRERMYLVQSCLQFLWKRCVGFLYIKASMEDKTSLFDLIVITLLRSS